MSPAEPDGISFLRVALAFAAVFGLLGLMGLALRHLAARGIKMPGPAGRKRRLEVVESLTIDVRRRLVLVRCDNKEHLILLGNQDVVVAQDVTKPGRAKKAV
jgi:flagellar protein FliO/FliZ